MAISYSSIGDAYADLGDFVLEVENNPKGLKIYEDLSRADPRNALLRQGLAMAYGNTASAVARAGNIGDGVLRKGFGDHAEPG